MFRTIEALGYHIVSDKPPTRLRPVRLPQTYVQTNGYKVIFTRPFTRLN